MHADAFERRAEARRKLVRTGWSGMNRGLRQAAQTLEPIKTGDGRKTITTYLTIQYRYITSGFGRLEEGVRPGAQSRGRINLRLAERQDLCKVLVPKDS
jgi:hypothetical protein